jgi:hypothetical protein
MTIYLYKKTHNVTGLKYLGKTTSKDPHKYKGSGNIWILHINKHGYDVTTEILKECQTQAEIKYWGLYYSTLWDIVNTKDDQGRKIWANLKPELGDGGSAAKGRIIINDGSKEKRWDVLDEIPEGWCKGRLENIGSKIRNKQIGIKKPNVSKALRGRKLSEEQIIKAKKGKENFLNKMTPDEKEKYFKDIGKSISASSKGIPKSEKHKKSMRKGMKIHRESLSQEEKNIKYGRLNKNKTWKLVDGKRVWFPKEN